MFFIGEVSSVIIWARLSDAYGRRPTLLLGLLGLSLSILSFGLSPPVIPFLKASTAVFVWMVGSRFLQGVFNGNMSGSARTMLGEVVMRSRTRFEGEEGEDVEGREDKEQEEKRKARAFGAIPMTWTVGAAIGYVFYLRFVLVLSPYRLAPDCMLLNSPLIGGYFSRPAKHWPSVFGNDFWIKHPYFLPCAIMGTITFLIFLGSVVGLREVRYSPYITRAPCLQINSYLSSADICTRDRASRYPRAQSLFGRRPRRRYQRCEQC